MVLSLQSTAAKRLERRDQRPSSLSSRLQQELDLSRSTNGGHDFYKGQEADHHWLQLTKTPDDDFCDTRHLDQFLVLYS